MTADLVNLRQARKRKLRVEKEKLAEANRTTFGKSKAARNLAKAFDKLDTAKLDGHKLDGAESED